MLAACLSLLVLAPAAQARPRLLVIGDSLAIGAKAPLAADLPDWRIRTSARIGRPLSEGMRVFRSLEPAPDVVAFSLFTNDDPRNIDALAGAVRESLDVERGAACAVWATVVRPRLAGHSYSRANHRLQALARTPELSGRLIIVPWAAKVARHPSWIGADRVHPTATGYVERARLYAQAVRRCATLFVPDA